MTSEADRRRLLKIARDAIVAQVRGASGEPDSVTPPTLESRGGVFVTIHHDGDLRGCIGRLEAAESLPHLVNDCAVAACSADPRFPPITSEELGGLDIELSLLGPLEPIVSPEEIEIGRHGLVVEKNRRRGLLLPQVAAEWKWDRSAFLAETCHKAGLPRDAWRHGAKVWRFEAEVFSEHDA
jgi:AmmeMemoRadiSam system protein A